MCERPWASSAWRNSLEASAGGASPWSLAHLTPEAFCGLLQAPPGACPSGRASPLPPRAAPTHAARELSTGHLPALTSARRLDGAWPRPLTRAALACVVGRSSPTDAAPTAPARADSQSLPTITACSSCPRHQEGLSCPESNLPALMNKLCYSSARGVTPPLCGTGSHGQPTKRKLN